MRLIHTEVSKTHPDLCVKVYRDPEWNEYRARTVRGGKFDPESDHHDDDKNAALQTARAMLAHAEGSAK